MASNILNLPTEETLQAIASSLQTMQGNVSGVKGNVEVTYRTGQVNLTAANIGALSSDTVYVSSVNGGSGAVIGIATQQELDEVRNIAEGAGAAMSFTNYAALVSDFNNATDDDYKLGQSIYINTLGVPDLWIYEVSDVQILYYYTTDEAFTQLLTQQGYVQIGYYKVAALETEKVDLTNYATLNTTQTFTGTKNFTDFSLINDYTNGKTLASYLSNVYTKTESDGKYVDLTSDQTITGKKNIQELHVSSRNDYDWNFIPEAGGAALGIRQGTASKLKVYTNAFSPSSDNSMNLGYSNSLRWKNFYLAGTINPNSSNYGVIIPSTTNYTNSQTISTVESITGFPLYNNALTYAVNDKIIYSGTPYRCTTAIATPENFDDTKWTQIQLKDYVDIDTNQVIKGTKTFKSIQFVKDTSDPTAGGKLEIQNDNGYNAKIRFNDRGFMFTAGSVYPSNTNVMDFGATNYLWKNIYLSGHLSDGNNSTYGLTLPDTTSYTANEEIATISSIGLPKVAAPASSTLIDAEFENFKNGCVIDGTYNGYQNPIIVPVGQHSSGTYYGCIIGQNGAKFDITGFEISSSKVLTIRPTLIDVGIRNNTVSLPYNLNIKGKDFPAYPSSPSNAQVLTYGTDNTLSWQNHMTEWYGTQAEYDALASYDSNTIYNILES